ncbi:hypothetical protein BDW22DRAFT_1352736, partial [Trametopsis cervina]
GLVEYRGWIQRFCGQSGKSCDGVAHDGLAEYHGGIERCCGQSGRSCDGVTIGRPAQRLSAFQYGVSRQSHTWAGPC